MPTDEHRTRADAIDAAELLRASLPTDLVSARWMPIYVEPIQFSGERITVCVAIVPDGQGAPVVTTTLAPNTVEKVLGAAGGYLVDLAGRIESDLCTHFLVGGDLRDWKSRYAGVYAGNISHSDGANLRALIASAMHCTSIFSIGLEQTRTRSNDGGLDLFRHQIKAAVLAERKWISDRFDRQTKIFGGTSKALFDYVGSDLAINLGKLDIGTSSHPQQRDRLLHRLHQLLALREDEKQIAHKVNNLMLGVWTPARHLSAKEEDTFGAYTTELEFAANRSGVTYILANEGAEGGEITSPFVSRILADA